MKRISVATASSRRFAAPLPMQFCRLHVFSSLCMPYQRPCLKQVLPERGALANEIIGDGPHFRSAVTLLGDQQVTLFLISLVITSDRLVNHGLHDSQKQVSYHRVLQS
jgi:hypothetical protein